MKRYCLKSLVFFITALTLVSNSYAIRKNLDGICILSAEVLADPNLFIIDVLENSNQTGSPNCNDIFNEVKEKKVDIHYPINGYKLKKAGWGVYRDYKIKSYKPGPDLEGYKTLIYEVEMIYISMERDAPRSPLCEYSLVPIRLVNTPWGWRFAGQSIFGSNLNAEIKDWERIYKVLPNDSPENVVEKEKVKNKHINELMKFSKQCAMKLK